MCFLLILIQQIRDIQNMIFSLLTIPYSGANAARECEMIM